MKLSLRHLPVAIACAAQSAWSADALVHITFDKNPLAGVEVRINKESKGTTDKSGNFFVTTGSGKQTVELVRDGTIISTVNFNVKGSEAVEVNVAFDTSKALPKTDVKQFSSLTGGAEGFIGGLITNSSDTPLSGVTVTSVETGESATSNENGYYSLELPRGKQSITFSHPEFAEKTVDGIYILADLGTAANIKLASKDAIEAPGSVEEVVVLGSYNPEDTAASLERYSSTVTDALDMTQLARFGDSNVAGALTRLVGVSVNDGKYAVVRGLDGRYISSSLNGFMMPSTDPMRRDVQLDLFPSNILQGVEVQKSYSPELSGTTTGGSLKIMTRGLPDERVNKLSISSGYTTGATGEEIATYRSSSTDSLGFDSGLRDLSDRVLNETDNLSPTGLRPCDARTTEDCATQLDLLSYGVAFEDDWNVESKTANPNFGLGYSYGDRIELDKSDVGFYGAVNYSSFTSNRDNATLSDPVAENGTYVRSQESVNLSAYFVAGLEFGEQDEILSKTIALRATDNITRRSDVIDGREGGEERGVILQWVERQFLSQQFSGHHAFEFSESHELDWRIGYSNTNRYEPDRRSYQYNNAILIANQAERRWNDLNEDSIDLGFNYKIPVELTDNIFTTFDFGALLSDKSREVELYRLAHRFSDPSFSASIDDDIEDVLSYQNFATNTVAILPTSQATDSYDSSEEIFAYYLNSTSEFGDSWTLTAGVRAEEFNQEITYPNNADVNSALEVSNFLPSVTLTYRATEDLQFRAGYSQTVSYPGLIERAQTSSFHPISDRQIFGNENLIASTIDNFDVRAEYYFSDNESISVALFSKEISNPIEASVADGARAIKYRNAISSSLNGLEIDFNKNIIDTQDFLGFISANLTLIDSEVTLDAASLRLEGEDSRGREMQGQSPALANIQFGLDHFETEQKFTVLLNYFDDKIFQATTGDVNTPEYFAGQIKLDANYEKLFGENLTLKFKAKNLLNAKTEFIRNNQVIESFEMGKTFSASLTYDF